MPLSVFATTVAVCSLSADPLCGPALPNLVANGSFETIDLTSWTLDCPDGACSVEPDSSGAGGHFRRTIVENPYTTLSQTLHLNPGRYALAYSILDSTVLHSPRVPNELTVRLGPVADLYSFGLAERHSYHEFVSNGGSTELSFEWFTLYFNSYATQTMVLDDISVVQLDDGGAAQSALSSLSATRTGAHSFIETIFSAQGSGGMSLAARPVAAKVAGPAMTLTAKTRAWASGHYSEASWDDFNTTSRDSAVSGGVEADAGDGWTAGFAGTIVDRSTGLNGPVSTVKSDGHSASFALYATWTPIDGAFRLRAAAGAGFSSRDHRRIAIFQADPFVSEDIDGSHLFASAEAGYTLDLAPGATLSPYVRLTGVQAREASYVEFDTSGFFGGTSVESETFESLTSQAGVRSVLTNILHSSLNLEVHGAWRHEFFDPNGASFTFNSQNGFPTTVTLPGLREGRDLAIYGAELEASIWDQTSIFVRYDGIAGDGHSVNSGQMGLRAVW